MPPITVMVKPASSLCNMRCTYCFYADVSAHRSNASFGMMEETTLENLVRKAFIYADNCVNFAFQGGEPTLVGKAFYRRFIELLKKYNSRLLPVQNAIQTNGYSLDREWCSIFRNGNFLVGISLDGTKELHDAHRVNIDGKATYTQILQNIDLLKAENIEYNILCVVNQQIANHPHQVFEALRKHKYLQFIPCLDGFDNNRQSFSLDSQTYGRFLVEIYDLYEQAIFSGKPISVRTFDNWIAMLLGQPPENCSMAGRCGHYFLVEANGNTYPCDFYVIDKWLMGNINDTSFLRMDRSPIACAFRNESIPLPDCCKACKWLYLCRGGCKRDREPIINGNPSLNHLCVAHRFFFEQRYVRMKSLSTYIAAQQTK